MDSEHRPRDGFQPNPHFHKLPVACTSCRRKKTRCSGELPSCHGCVKTGGECVYKGRNGIVWSNPMSNMEFLPAEASTTANEDGESVIFHPPDKSQTMLNGRARQRILAACAACRRKKTRCPGERPACVPCIRSGMTCVYESRKGNSNVLVPPGSVTPSPGFTPLTFEASQTAALEQLNEEFENWRHRQRMKACAFCRKEKVGCDGQRPCSGCQKAGVACVECGNQRQSDVEQSPNVSMIEQRSYEPPRPQHEEPEEPFQAQITFTPANAQPPNNEASQKPAGWEPKRPHKCDQCDLTFVRAEHLKRHRPTHTGEKPFACPHENCGKAFSRADQLLRHRRTHGGFTGNDTNIRSAKAEKKAALRRDKEPEPQGGNARICYGCEKRFKNGNAFYGHWPCFGGTPGYREVVDGQGGAEVNETMSSDQRQLNNFGDLVSQLEKAATSQ